MSKTSLPPPRLSPFYAALSGRSRGCVGFICNPGRCPRAMYIKCFQPFEFQVQYIFRQVTGGDYNNITILATIISYLLRVTGGDYNNITFDIPDKGGRRPEGAVYIKPNAARWAQHGHHHNPALKGQHTPGLMFSNAIHYHLNEFQTASKI